MLRLSLSACFLRRARFRFIDELADGKAFEFVVLFHVVSLAVDGTEEAKETLRGRKLAIRLHKVDAGGVDGFISRVEVGRGGLGPELGGWDEFACKVKGTGIRASTCLPLRTVYERKRDAARVKGELWRRADSGDEHTLQCLCCTY